MSAIGLSSVKGRRPALIAGATALILLGLLIAAPVALLFMLEQDSIDASLQDLADYQAEAAKKPAVEAQLQEARQRASGVPGLIAAGNASLAQAKMQSEMESVVGQAGGQVRSAQILPASKTKGFEIIAIQYDLVLPTSRLRDLVYAIEAHTPYFFIDNADIVSSRDVSSGDPASGDPSLELHWVVRGYRWAGTR